MNLLCVGISHHTASVETRERYACEIQVGEFRNASGCAEALLLTTCNRVEVYAVAEHAIPTGNIVEQLRNRAEQDWHGDLGSFYRLEGARCVEHLFRVVCGFDSMVVGETEILGQAKQAYTEARAAGSAGPILHRLFQRAFRVAKQVRTRTGITRGAVSVGAVAVELAGKIFGNLCFCRVLLVGAGENGERTARALISRGVRDLRVTNRSSERAQALATEVGGVVIEFKQWEEQCREVDILISSTAAHDPILTRLRLEPLLRQRRDRPLFIIDIAVPRDVEPGVNELEGVYLYDMDSLQAIADESHALRRQQIAAGEEIIAGHVAEFCDKLGLIDRVPRERMREEIPLDESLRRSSHA